MDKVKKLSKKESEALKLQKRTETKQFEMKLIIEIESHKCLYAKDDAAYKDKYFREEAWLDVAAVLDKSVLECQNKWNNLRDAFRGYFKAENNIASGSGATAPIKWIHFQSMKFLIPYIKVPFDDCGNFSSLEENHKNIVVNESRDVEFIDADIEVINLSKPTTSSYATTYSRSQPSNKQKKRKIEENSLDKVLHAIENTNKRPMDSFFENISGQIEHFTKAEQLEFQMKILNILKTDFSDQMNQ